ncbi:MAG: hypothetical protein ACOCTI_03970, partial [Phycisphaeraceae bacterium]
EGLATGERTVFDRFVKIARQGYERYQSMPHLRKPGAERTRLGLPTTFRQTLVDSYAGFMRSPEVDLMRRVRAYRTTPVEVIQEAWPRFWAPLYDQARAAGMNPEQVFPPPSGASEGPLELPQGAGDEETETIERQ